MDETLLYEVADKVATITINRERQRNALDDATLFKLRDALETAKRGGFGAIVLKGAGLKAFSAGSDIKEMAIQSQAEQINHTELGQEIGDFIERHPAPVIAAIEGYCLGGGLEMSLACDLRIAGAAASLGLPEVRNLSALPSWGGTVRLPRIVGQHPRFAFEIACEARQDGRAVRRRIGAALCDHQGVGRRLGQVGEGLLHHARRLDEAFRIGARTIVRIDMGRTGDAQHGVMRLVHVRFGEIGRIGGHQWEIARKGKLDQRRLGPLLSPSAAPRDPATRGGGEVMVQRAKAKAHLI